MCEVLMLAEGYRGDGWRELLGLDCERSLSDRLAGLLASRPGWRVESRSDEDGEFRAVVNDSGEDIAYIEWE